MARGFVGKFSLVLLCLVPLIFTSGIKESYANISIEKQRKLFGDAKRALKKGQLRKFNRINKKLIDYPLYGYLQYNYFIKRLSRLSENRIKNFLEVYSDSPISDRLRYKWLQSLARKGKWKTFLKYYRPVGGANLRCRKGIALFKTKKIEEAKAVAEKLWLVGKSQPRTCDQLFSLWKKHDGLTEEKIWARVILAMEKGRTRLAKFIGKKLSKKKQRWIARWKKMHRHPAENLLRNYYKVDAPIPNMIVRHGIKRLARRDAGAASDAWESIRKTHIVESPEEVRKVDQYIALRGGFQKNPKALEWLGKLEKPNAKVQDWRIRSALGQQDWWAALTWIEALPDAERNSEQWRYWRARILELQSQSLPVLKTASERIYASLSKERSYHGFLAADRLGSSYQFNASPLKFSENELNEIEKVPGIERARELFFLGMVPQARREWAKVTSAFKKTDLKKASVLASRWNWHDRAISTVAKASHYDDIGLRFPTAYKDIVLKQAKEQGIEPAWIYGVLRQESTFMPDARSGAGALGLMQLMPKTGRMTARQLKFRIRSNNELLNVNKNIRLGSAYLRRMLDENNGNNALATASYNAGPYRVKQWLPEQDMPSDIWVETIPFNETRKYVRRVMSYTVIYDDKLNGKVQVMGSRMPDIKVRKNVDS